MKLELFTVTDESHC